jgi:pimeloyl-ACP methyl ester carboxylesterase
MPAVTRDGVELYWHEQGRGPVVFWHTGGGGDGSMWARAGYLDALPAGRHLLFDHRGHGRSGKPTALEAHRLHEYVEDVLAVLDAAGIQNAAFVGYSDGARVGYRLAAEHPERVSAVVGIGGVPHPSDTDQWRRELAREVRKRTFRAWLEEMSAGESEPAPDWLLANLASTSTEMFALEVEGWADQTRRCAEDFARISAPVLIICGALENTDGAAELAAQALVNGACRILPGFGHLQAFWRTDVTAPLILRFLAAHVGA